MTGLQRKMWVFFLMCGCGDSQVGYVRSIQRGQHAPSSEEAVLHDGETLQQLLPVNRTTRYSPLTAVFAVNSPGKSSMESEHFLSS